MKLDLEIVAEVLKDFKVEICTQQSEHELLEVQEMSNSKTINSSSYHRGYACAMEIVLIKNRYLLSHIINKQRSKNLNDEKEL